MADEEAEQELRALVQLLDNFMQRDAVDFSEGAADGTPPVPVGEVCSCCQFDQWWGLLQDCVASRLVPAVLARCSIQPVAGDF